MSLAQESLSWTTFGIAVGATGIAVLALLILLVVITRRRAPSAELELALRESSTRMEAMLAELAGALEAGQTQVSRTRQINDVGTTIDLDEVLTRTLEAAGALLDVDGAMVALDDGGEETPLVATVGLSEEEAESYRARVEWGTRRAAIVTYLYPSDKEPGESIRGSVQAPLRGEGGGALGTLSVFWRATERRLTDDDIALLEELAQRSGPAVENARRFQEARHLADLDSLTGLHNYRYFHETLAREVARAQRYDRQLALVIFDIDDFKTVNDRVGHLAGDSVLAETAQRVRSIVRGADIACRVGGDEFAVILPESAQADAESLYERLQHSLRSTEISTGALALSAGIAELRADDDAVTFFKRADEALYRAKARGKGQAIGTTSEA